MKKFITRKQNIVLYGKYKGRNINAVPLNYLLWVQKNIYNDLSRQQQNVIDSVIDYKLEVVLDKKIANELKWLKN